MVEKPKKPLNKDVSVQELLYYREQGMRNSEIAKLLGTTPVTIRKYIGGDGRKGRPPKNRDLDPKCREEVKRNNYEKVIRAVETCFDSWIDKHRNMGLDLHEVERLKGNALDLLKEQEPIAPKLIKMYPHDIYECGNCKHRSVGSKDYKAKYCPECGMAVKWDD